MANFNTLNSYYENIISPKKGEVETNTVKFLKMAFEDRKTYAYPEWIWDALYADGCEAPLTHVEYDRDIVTVRVYSVSADGLDYYIGGRCVTSNMSDDVTDIQCWDKDAVMEFIAHFIGCNIDKLLDDLYNRIRSCTRMGDVGIVIEDWCQEEGYDFDYIDTQAVTQWASDRFNQETANK